MASLFDSFNRVNADREYQAVEEDQNAGVVNYNTYYGYSTDLTSQNKIQKVADSTRNLRYTVGYGQSDGARIQDFSALRNGVTITHYGEPQQLKSKIAGPAFIYRQMPGTEKATQILQSEQSVARKQTHGLVGVSLLEGNILTPQLPCIKKIQHHEFDKSNPFLNIRKNTYVDTRMLHRN